MAKPAPWDALDGILSDSSPADTAHSSRPCVIRDGWMGSQIDSSDYRRAIDTRSFQVVKAFSHGGEAAARITVAGRQVGTLDSIVATGRRFATFAHVEIPLDHARPIAINANLTAILALSGMQFAPAVGTMRLRSVSAASRADLLDSDTEATYWARRWRLPPRLARIAVLLMAGVTAKEIAERLNITVKSARTYTEQLFALADVHGRNELASAALRDGMLPALRATPTRGDRQEQPGESP